MAGLPDLLKQWKRQFSIGAADGSRPREVLVSSLDEVFGSTSSNSEEFLKMRMMTATRNVN